MKEGKFHKQFREGDELPVPIPPTDQAWNDMRARLDAGMPENTSGTGGSKISLRSILKWFIGVVLLFFISWIVLTQLPAKKGKDISNETDAINNTSVITTLNSDSVTAAAGNIPGNTSGKAQSNTDTVAGTALNSSSEHNEAFVPSSRNTDKQLTEPGNSGSERLTAATKKQPGIAGADLDKTVKQKDKSGRTHAGEINADAINTGANTTTGSNAAKKDKPTGKNRTIVNRPTGGNKASLKDKKDGEQNSRKGSYTSKQPGGATTAKPAGKDLLSTTVVRDNSQAPVVDRHLPGTLHVDSSATAKPAITSIPPIRKFQYGLQWTAQLPSGNMGSYFTGPTGNSEPWRILLPAAWLNYRHNRSSFSVEVNPFFSTAVPAKPYDRSNSSYRIGDTLYSQSEVKTLRKLFGVSAAIGYTYNVSGNWWVGGSLRGNWWKKAVALSQQESEIKPDTPGIPIRSSSSKTYLITDTSWSNISKMQAMLSVDILYKRPLWQAGLQVGMPLMALTKQNGPRTPLYAAFVFRLAIPDGKRKR